jgi:hypothetical protein
MNNTIRSTTILKIFIISLTALAIARAPLRAQPMLQIPVIASNAITLTWSAVPGQLYQLQCSTNLSSNSNGWSDLSSFIVATTNAVTCQDAFAPIFLRLYRVKLLATNFENNYSPITSATGGNFFFTNGDFITCVFTESGNLTIVSGSGPVESLVVGGGGGGGAYGGGGGAGGLIHTPISLSPTYGTGTYPVVVGGGGAGGYIVNSDSSGFNGGNSSFNSPDVVAYGGGGGASFGPSGTDNLPGGSGGSGGGGCVAYYAANNIELVNNPGPSVFGMAYGSAVPEGNSGGVGDSTPFRSENGGGGGGAGGAGGNASGYTTYDGDGNPDGSFANGGPGGNGLYFGLTGNAGFDTWYAGGGGGSANSVGQGGLGSNDYGGLGGGGDGGGHGGSGAAGIVILRYRFQ